MSLEEIRGRAQREQVSLHLILKELIHFLVLDFLSRRGAFSELVFQGGTALRVAYQGLRYSEDLDFVLRRRGKGAFRRLPGILKLLPSELGLWLTFGQGIRLKEQKATALLKRYTLMIPIGELRATDRTNIEVACVPSYDHEPLIIRNPALPLTVALQVETPRELLGDKLTAFGAREYLKGRDIWDIHFLLNTMGVVVDQGVARMVARKISDYRLSPARFWAGFTRNLSLLKTRGALIVQTEMDRFLPLAQRELFRGRYPSLVRGVLDVLDDFGKRHRTSGRS